MTKKYGISDEKVKKIINGYLHTNAGAKKLSWFYEVDLEIVKTILKDLKNDWKKEKAND